MDPGKASKDCFGSHLSPPTAANFEHAVVSFDDEKGVLDGTDHACNLLVEAFLVPANACDKIREAFSLHAGERWINIEHIIAMLTGIDDDRVITEAGVELPW